MKKISAVLLVLVLVGSVVFAGFTGYAQTDVSYNLDTAVWGFTKQDKVFGIDVSFLEVIGEKKGEGDVYADIKGTLAFTFSNGDNQAIDATKDEMLIDASLDYAKIVGKDWYVGILEAVKAANFATSAIDSEKEGTADTNDLGYNKAKATYYADVKAQDYYTVGKGIEIGYKDYVVGFSAFGDANDTPVTYDVFGSLKTPEYALADGIKVQLGVAGQLTQADKAASVNAKVAYTSDKLTANVGADVIYDNGLHADVAAKVVYDMVTVDGYYATDTTIKHGATNSDKDLLSAKVAVALDNMTVTLTGKDLINKKDLSASVKFQATKEMAVTPRGGYNFGDEKANGGADVEYKAADYTAKLGGTYYTTNQIKLNASVESTKLIPGATLTLAYAGDDLLSKIATVAKDKGVVTATVKIAF
ncbi:MAG: hypothetical protein AB9828_08850 [Sphaerochaetaceae bacterium]